MQYPPAGNAPSPLFAQLFSGPQQAPLISLMPPVGGPPTFEPMSASNSSYHQSFHTVPNGSSHLIPTSPICLPPNASGSQEITLPYMQRSSPSTGSPSHKKQSNNRFETKEEIAMKGALSELTELCVRHGSTRYNLLTGRASGVTMISCDRAFIDALANRGGAAESTIALVVYGQRPHGQASFAFECCEQFNSSGVCRAGLQCPRVHVCWEALLAKEADSYAQEEQAGNRHPILRFATERRLPAILPVDAHYHPFMTGRQIPCLIRYPPQSGEISLQVPPVPTGLTTYCPDFASSYYPPAGQQHSSTIAMLADCGDVIPTKGSRLVLERSPDAPRRPMMCAHFEQGVCTRGANCCFVHYIRPWHPVPPPEVCEMAATMRVREGKSSPQQASQARHNAPFVPILLPPFMQPVQHQQAQPLVIMLPKQ